MWWRGIALLLIFLAGATRGDDEHHHEAESSVEEVKAAPKAHTKQPHILFIIIDDAGTQDVGYSASDGSPLKLMTPNIDSLAEEAVRLNEYYTHPTCTPSRAALLSGKYAHKVGLPFPLLGHPIAGIDSSVVLLPQLLREVGYKTHMVGKWHIGHAKKSMLPLSRGFDTFFGLHGGGFDHYTKDAAGVVDLWRQERQLGPSEVDTKEHATEMFTREAVQVIRDHHATSPDAPFFMYLSYTAPHDPLQADDQYLYKCEHVQNVKRRQFCGMMAQLDNGIGTVLDTLMDLGMLDDTLIAFTSDNGGNAIVGGFNYNFRGCKSMAWEGGVRVPGFVRPPKFLDWPSRDYAGLMHIADWMPTLLGVAGAKVPSGIDGIDMAPTFATLEAHKSPRTTAVIQHDVFLNSTAYRSGCLKLLLGNTGGNVIFLEADEYLLNMKDEGQAEYKLQQWSLRVTEYLFMLIEALIPAPIDQFLKYTVSVNAARLSDYYFQTSYNHVISHLQRLDLWKANLTEMPPILDFGLEYGPRTYVFNVCKDPSESFNLVNTPQGRKQAQQLFEELMREMEGAPLQYAGDVLVHGTDAIQFVGPFLDEDEDIANYPNIRKRLFAWLDDAFVVMGVVLAALSTLFTLMVVCCCCCRRGPPKEKTE